ncbi:receptor-type tyrosine-protein phosphatase alpha-like isoform X3 [Zophobas morio]|uniref:receptor-type tyrosine-protein phosphatase alpha-like isoform X3 n=1 Tax=Zophobas morio TaxID=2755281 RepID=UPI003082F48C
MIFLILVLVILAGTNSQEIITLQNKTDFVCLVEDKDLVIYTKPPVAEVPENTEVLLEKDFFYNWTLKQSEHVAHGPVIDKRWEGFKTIYRDQYNFSKVVSASFSIYFSNIPCRIMFITSENDSNNTKPINVTSASWTHYTLHYTNKTLTVYENGSSCHDVSLNSNSFDFVVKTTYRTAWKIHSYRIRVANESSPTETVVSTGSTGVSCLIFYIYLCPKCLLKIYTSGGMNRTVENTPDSMMENELFKSQKVLVKVNTTLTLVRETRSGAGKPYWAIDIRECPSKNLDTSIYKAKLSKTKENRTCELLFPKKESETELVKTFPRINCTAGFLGHKCDLRCDELLGPEASYCENHTICGRSSSNSSCVCSWGFQGSSCAEPCKDGMWGLSCKNKCINCGICDKKTGECSKDHTTSETTTVKTTTLSEASNSNNFTLPVVPKSSMEGTIIFSNILPPTSNDSTKAYFVLSKKYFINSTGEIIAYALLLFEGDVDIKSTNGFWDGTFRTWPSSPQNSLQLTPDFWNPFKDEQHTCNFIIGASSSCCKVHCYNTPLKPNTRYWLMVRALTNQTYNDSTLLFFQTASDASSGSTIISLAVLMSLFPVMVILIYVMYKRRRKNQAIIVQEEEEKEEEEMIVMLDKTPETTVIEVNTFENYCLQPTFLTTLKTQFGSLSDSVPSSSSTGLQPKNINKNRDRSRIVPYDSNRVVLNPMDGVGTEDYINASYIVGYDRPKAYIACQSPKFYTVKDFWRMIWQEDVSVIIMATEFFERKERMCAEYWPQRLSEVYECGEILVKLLKKTTFEVYIYHELQVIYGDNIKIIHNYHVRWSLDNFNMLYPNNILPVVKLIRQLYDKSHGPIVFHSGYGTNQSGILILCDLALQMIKTDNKVDFFSLTKALREQRMSMISSVEHYIFSHLVVAEYFLEHRSPFQYSTGQKTRRDDIKKELQFLETLHRYDAIFHDSNFHYCIPRCPFQNVKVLRYGQKRKYVISKEPRKEQLLEYWKMVARESISCVLFINKKFPLTTMIRGQTEVVKITRERITDTTYGLITEASLLIYNKTSNEKFYDDRLHIFQFNDWKVNQFVPNSVHTFISMVNYIHRFKAEDELVLVSCSDGFTACGVFVAFSYIIEKYEKEVEIDVCSALRTARRGEKSFVNRALLDRRKL